MNERVQREWEGEGKEGEEEREVSERWTGRERMTEVICEGGGDGGKGERRKVEGRGDAAKFYTRNGMVGKRKN